MDSNLTPIKMNFFKNQPFLVAFAIISTFFHVNAQVTNCNTIDCIQNAMATAQPGTEIVIASGTYNFSINDKIPGAFGRNAYLHSAQNGTSSNRIILRGASASSRPVIKGFNYDDGYLLGLEGNYWTIKDIEFRTGSKGVILDNADYTELYNLEIHDVGDEALHFRHGTAYSSAEKCFIHDTGKKQIFFGEGIYIGSDRSVHNSLFNDGDTFCEDWKRDQGRCGRFYNPSVHHITIRDSDIGPNVTAEHFDVREGSWEVVIENNVVDAKGQGTETFLDSFIDLKGAHCYVRNNTFNQNGSSTTNRGIQVLDRDDKNEVPIEITAINNVIHDNIFNMDDTDTPILTFFDKRGGKNYAYNNTRNPNGTIYKAGSDFVEAMEPNFGSVSYPEGNQYSDLGETGTLSNDDFIKKDINFTVTPNPAKEFITISSKENIEDIAVYNLQGQQMDTSFSINTSSISVSHLATGTYIIQVSIGKTFDTKMLAIR